MRQWNDKYSLVRVLHAVPEGEDVDIYINDTPLYKGLEFTEFSPYIYVPKGDYEFSVYLEDTKDNPLIKQKITINVNELVTVAITGNTDDLELLPIKEDIEAAEGNNSKVRAVHLSPNTPEVNILADENILFENVKFRDVTEYKQVAPKVYRVDIVVSKGNKILRSNQVTINSNRVYTFYALGNAPNVQIIQSLDGGTFLI